MTIEDEAKRDSRVLTVPAFVWKVLRGGWRRYWAWRRTRRFRAAVRELRRETRRREGFDE